MTLEELAAREEIRDCIYRYCRAIDRGDTELLRTVYHDDAVDEHGIFNGAASEFIEVAASYAGEDSPYSLMQHLIGNVLIELEGEVAYVESYFRAYHKPRDPSQPDAMLGGRYVDRFERRDGRWAIAHRRVVYDWSRVQPVTRDMWEEWPAEADAIHFGGPRDVDSVYNRDPV